MTNVEIAIATLSAHREARQWSDEVVAADLLARLGLDPAADQSEEAPVSKRRATRAASDDV